MSLTAEERAAFVTAYTRLLISSWSDESYNHRLDTDATGALAAAGIDLPAGSHVEIVRTDSYHPTDTATADATDGPAANGIDKQVALYEQDLPAKRFTFYLPAAPKVPTEQLAADELHGVAAGGVWDPYCCSCCPNCCSASGG